MQKSKKIKFILTAIFIFVIVFGLGKTEKVEAETYTCVCNIPTGRRNPERGTCDGTKDQCDQQCESRCNDFYEGENGGFAISDADKPELERVNTDYREQQNAEAIERTPVIGTASKDSCSLLEWKSSPTNCMFLTLLNLMTWLMKMAVSIFQWTMEPNNIKTIIGNDQIYKAWGTVRDILNVSFIMFLLFSAFATVFQIEKYSYKKTLLMIVIMALLVNFSFPIARFIIDLSNMMMFYFSDALGISGAQTMVDFASDAQLPGIIHSNINGGSTTYVLIAVIFTFIFSVTILIVSVLFLIRIIALAILIIFSSLAFIGAAISPLSSYADDWWKKIFGYSFFGPIMLFMIYVASNMMNEIGKSGKGSMEIIAAGQTNDPTFLASIAFFSIPIVILWLGLGIAQSMSIEGAGAVVGQGKKFMGWAGKTLTGYRAATWGTKALVGKEGKVEQFMARNKVLRWVSPTALQKGWQARSETKKKEAFGPASGAWKDLFNKYIDKTKTNEEQLERDRLDASRTKEIKETSQNSSYLLNLGKGLIGVNSESARRDWKAIFSILFANRDQDEIMAFVRKHYNDKDSPFKDLIREDELGASGWNADEVVKKILRSCGEDEYQLGKFLMDHGEVAAGNTGVGFGAYDYDENGQLVAAPNKWAQAKAAVGKMVTTKEVQGLARDLHRNNITSEIMAKKYDEKGNVEKDADGNEILLTDKHGETYKEVNAEFSEMVRRGVFTDIKDHIGRHNSSFYDQVGRDPQVLRGMRVQVEKLAEGEKEWKDGKLQVTKIDKEKHDAAMEWIDTLEFYVNNGRKPKDSSELAKWKSTGINSTEEGKEKKLPKTIKQAR